MKFLVFALVIAVTLGAPSPQVQEAVPTTIIPYSYEYSVSDHATGNYQNRAEVKTALGDVFGSWSVLMPDGYIYTTTYNATALGGFQPIIVRTLPQAAASLLSAAPAGNTAA